MKRRMGCKGEWFLLFLVVHTRLHVAEGATKLPLNGLVLHYYKKHTNCTYTEEFIKHLVKKAWDLDKSITPALLRLVYSDCFVRVCINYLFKHYYYCCTLLYIYSELHQNIAPPHE